MRVVAGGFGIGFNLLSHPLALRQKREYIVLARVSPAKVARLNKLPALVYTIEADTVPELIIRPTD